MNFDEKVALSNCDREPVHIPGRIQSFGSMLAFDRETGLITHHSDNLLTMLGQEGASLLEKPYTDLIDDRQIVHGVRGALSLPTIKKQRDRIGLFDIAGQPFDISVYATQGHAVVEFEPDSTNVKPQSPVSTVRSMMSAVHEGSGLTKLLETAVKALRHITGHDRVMAYQFLDNGDGEIVAEAKGPGIEAYLGLRYPAWDIPTQVRQIMLRAPFRVIKDIHAEQSALVQQSSASPLDMTLSHLRGISPIYIEYLTNMGVRATLNISIIVRGQLWGMFAFHHYRPRQLTPDQRSICELFGQLVSMMIQKEYEQTKLTCQQQAMTTLSTIDSMKEDVESCVKLMAPSLMEITASDGVVLVKEDGTTLSFGETPSEQVTKVLVEQATEEVAAIDSLGSVAGIQDDPSVLNKSAGALLLRLADAVFLVFYRNEVVHSVRWAGAKEKEITVGPNGPRLTPRGSFAEYIESVAGRCEPWTEKDFTTAGEVCRAIWKVLRTNTQKQSRDFERQKQYKDLLIAELNHRVRNTLALVRSIARQTQSSSGSLEQYVEMLESRISALSSAHDLIGGSGLQWARIQDLLRIELKPYQFDEKTVTIEGSSEAVRADMAPIIALLFHEMVFNAAKHGALSEAGGRIAVRWFDEGGGIAIEWKEMLTRPVSEPERRGFGFALIERALPFECGGRSTVEFEDDQLRIKFWLPGETIDRQAESSVASVLKDKTKDDRSSAPALNETFKTALVVEDNLVLAMEVERLLIDMGIESVDTVPNVELAKAAIEKVQYDCAVLDINLGSDTSFEIAVSLRDTGTAVVLASGYDSKYKLPEALVDVPRIVKPIGRVEVADAIMRARP